MLEDSCFYSAVPAEAVTIAMLKYALLHILPYERKVKSLNKLFLLEQCAVSTVTTSVRTSKCSLSALTQAHNSFPTRLLPCR